MMVGQGSPKASRRRFFGRALDRLVRAAVGILAAWSLVEAAVAGEETIRVRLAWGGGPERTWQGRIALSEGTLSEPSPLGLEADEAGLMSLEPGRPEIAVLRGSNNPRTVPRQAAEGYLAVRPWSPRSYDGVDLLVTAPLEASLFVDLSGVDEPHPDPEGARARPGWIEVRLTDLIQKSFAAQLDDRGNRLVVRRSPGDDLRVTFSRRSLVFRPGEVFRCQLEPHLLPVAAGTKLSVKVQLLAARSTRELWSEEHAAVAGQPVAFPLEVPLGREEGVYDLVATVHHATKLPWTQPGRTPWGLRQPPIAERAVQVAVLSPQAPAAGGEPGRLSVVEEIEPAPSRGRPILGRLPQLPRLARLGKNALTSGHSQPAAHALGPVVQLAPNETAGEISWEAHWLSISRPGEPHVLEVEYPSDVPQTLAISIIEPNAAGAVVPFQLDSGIDHADEVAAPKSPAQWLRHRLVFWPRTRSPVVLLANRRDKTPAVFGRIRVLAGWQHLPRAFAADGSKPERLLIASLDRPLLSENFGASETLGASAELSAKDWVTFYEAGTRLVQYLHYVGYNGLMLSVLADGSTLYPSQTVSPTPRYDTGAYFTTGQDPVRKDVLEMLLRLFDREGLQMIPAIEMASPLPELEAVLRRGGAEAEGIQWVGPDGATWLQVHAPRKGKAPYYNVLHPRVQEAVLQVVRELAAAYGEHPSFAGLALQLSPDGYAQLPGPEWGLDDATIARFERDTKVRLPGEGPQRFAQRAAALSYETAEGQREWHREWLQWRASQLAQFYRRVRAELSAVRTGSRLYLAGGEMLKGEALASRLRPSLPRKTTVADALLWIGIDARQYAPNDGIVLLRPERIVPRTSLAAQAIDLEIGQLPDADRYYQGLSPAGSLFLHWPQEARLASFDEKSPFRPCYTHLATQAVPSAWQNRRRFAHALASLDAQVIVDGGWLLSLGQEESLRALVAAYRQLPAIQMERVAGPGTIGRMVAEDGRGGPGGAQTVAVRCGTRGDRTYVCVANDAPFATTTRLRVEAPAACRVQELTGSRPIEPLKRDAEGTYWDVPLGPYDVVAASFSLPGVRLARPEVAVPREVQAVLDKQVRELGSRAAALRNPPLLEVLENPGFDRPAGPKNQIPGWLPVQAQGVSIHLDDRIKHSGSASLRLASTGPAGGVVSEPFAPPASGRLAMLVRMRVADPARQPPVRLVIEGRTHPEGTRVPGSRTVAYYARFGQSIDTGAQAQPIAAEWGPYFMERTDLPLESLSAMRVRLELSGPGEVWIDDVQLCDLAFNKREVTELLKLITPVQLKLQNGELAECIHLLEGYWPRLLAEKVRLVDAAATGRLQQVSSEQSPPKQPDRSANLFDRVRSLVPEKLRF